jgi:steroid delta-isomerase
MKLHCPDSLATMAGFFNGLSLAKLDSLGDVYSPSVEFQDPLHHTHGVAALRTVYEHTLTQLSDVSVTVLDAHGDDISGFLLWTMRYQLRGKPREITGTCHLKYAADGRVVKQRDYWDASFPVYGEYPLLGPAMRAIKRNVAAKLPGGK